MKILIPLIIILSIQHLLQAQTLDDYLAEGAENNPALRASFSQYLSMVEKAPQVGSLPDPQVTFGYFIKPMAFAMGDQRAEVSLMQMFPWFGMIKTQKDEASLMAKAEYERFRETKNQLYLNIKETWFQLHGIENKIKATEENLEILRTIERMALIRFQGGGTGTSSGGMSGPNMQSGNESASGGRSMGGGPMGGMGGSERSRSGGRADSGATLQSGGGASMASSGNTSMADVLRAQIEIKEMENNLASLQDARMPLITRFNNLLNRSRTDTVILVDTLLPGKLHPELVEMHESHLQNSPMIKMLDAEYEVYQSQKRMAKLQGRPMVGLGVNYMIFSPNTSGEMPMGGDNMVMPMISFNLPIYRKKFNALIREAELKEEAVTQQKSAATNELDVLWEEGINALKDAERKLKLYKEQYQLAEQALEIMITSYATNGVSFEEILRVQQQLLDYKLQLSDTVVAQNSAIANLEMLGSIWL